MPRVLGVEKPGVSLAGVLFRVVLRKLGTVPRPLRIHALSRTSLRGYAMMEGAQESAKSVPQHLRKLAQPSILSICVASIV